MYQLPYLETTTKLYSLVSGSVDRQRGELLCEVSTAISVPCLSYVHPSLRKMDVNVIPLY